MYNAKRGIERLFWDYYPLLLSLLIIQPTLCGGEMAKKSRDELKAKRDFILTTNDRLLSQGKECFIKGDNGY